MPKFGSVFSTLQAKLEEARISDLNHELGKWAQESKAYVSSFKTDSIGFRPSSLWRRPTSNVPKSTSVPAGLTLFPTSRNNSCSRFNDKKSDRYQYRSSTLFEEEELTSGDLIDEELKSGNIPAASESTETTVVEKFIKVIEGSSGSTGPPGLAFKSREEIRKKLAFGTVDDIDDSKRGLSTDLEVCFINELKDEEDLINDQRDVHTKVLPRSKSEYVSISHQSDSSESSAYTQVACRLADCKDIARRKILIEKRNRKFHHINTLNKLIGKSIESKLSTEILSQMNTPTLQVIVNDFHSKIENLNEELVNELMQKDELQIEQDGQLVDIDDLAQSLNKEKL